MLQYLCNPLGGLACGSDIDQSANDIPDHVLQIRIGRDIDTNHIALALNTQVMDRSNRVLRLAIRRAESAEIMLANQRTRARLHQFHVEPRVEPANVLPEQSGALGTIQEEITVTPVECAETGVKLVTDHFGPAHCNRVGQHGVHTPYPRAQWTLRLRVKVNNLAKRMHTRVGPAGAYRFRFVGCDLAQRGLKRILHTASFGLRLPSAERGAIVFDSERYAHFWEGG